MKRKTEKGILITVLLLAIGFAAVTTTLIINGTTQFGVNPDNFVIIFTKAVLDGKDISDTVISKDGKTITYTTSELSIKGEKSILDFEVTNTSTQYDANVKMECSAEGENATEYYKITHSIPDVIKAKTIENGDVTVEVLKTSVNEIEEEFKCTITATAIEREVTAEVNAEIINDVDLDGLADLGDEIAIGEEEFYVLSNDGKTIKMLSKYNLAVGQSYTYNFETNEEIYTDIEYTDVKQGSDMLGADSDNGYPFNGVVPFASEEKHGKYYSSYSGSIAEDFINKYEEYLTVTYNIGAKASMITKTEIDEIAGIKLESGDLSDYGVPEWLYSTSYWTTSYYDEYEEISLLAAEYRDPKEAIWFIASDGYLDGRDYDTNNLFGIRPVVTIPVIGEVITEVCNGNICWADNDLDKTKSMGDEIRIGDEEFRVLGSDNENIRLLSKYNLAVGQSCTDDSTTYVASGGPTLTCTDIEYTDVKQGSDMFGMIGVMVDDYAYYPIYPFNGVVPYANEEKNGTNYGDYTGSIVEGYVNEYVAYLKTEYNQEVSGSLLKKEDIEGIIGVSISDTTLFNNGELPKWLYSTSYWLASAYDTENVWGIFSAGGIDYLPYNEYASHGVRPVITISKDII